MRTRTVIYTHVPVTSWLTDLASRHWTETRYTYREDAHETYMAAAEYISAHGMGSGITLLGERDKWGAVSIEYSGTAYQHWEPVNLDHIRIAIYLDTLDPTIPVRDGIEDPEICRAVWRCMTHVNMTPDELRAAVLSTMFKMEALGVHRGDWTYDCLEKTMKRRMQA